MVVEQANEISMAELTQLGKEQGWEAEVTLELMECLVGKE